MSQSIGDLEAKVRLDIIEFTRNLSKVSGDIEKMTVSSNSHFESMANKANSSFGSIAKVAGGMFAAFGAYKAIDLAKDSIISFVDAAMKIEGVKTSMTVTSGSAKAMAEDFEFVRKQSEALGFDLIKQATSYNQLAASAMGTELAGAGVRDIFSAIATASRALNLSQEQTQGSLYAVSQMMSKGVVSSEELRQQLGERLPGAFNLAAKAMGVSTAELNKMLAEGEIIASDFLPRFAKSLQQNYAGAVEQATLTLQGQLGKAQVYWTELSIAIGEKLTPVITEVVSNFNSWYQEQVRLQESGLPNFIDNTANTIATLTSGVQTLVKWLVKVGEVANLRSVTDTFVEGADLAAKGKIAWEEFASAGFMARQQMVDSAKAQDELNKTVERFKISADGSSMAINEYKVESEALASASMQTQDSINNISSAIERANTKQLNYEDSFQGLEKIKNSEQELKLMYQVEEENRKNDEASTKKWADEKKKAIDEAKKAAEEYQKVIEKEAEAHAKEAQAAHEASQKLNDMSSYVDYAANVHKELAQEIENADLAADAYSGNLNKLSNNYDEQITKLKQFASSVKLSAEEIDFINQRINQLSFAKMIEEEERAAQTQRELITGTDAYSEHLRKVTLAAGSFADGLKLAFRDATFAQETWAERGYDLFKEFTDSLTDSTGSSIYHAMKGDFDKIGDDWKDLLDSMLKWAADTIAEIAVQWAMSELFKWFGGDSTVSITDPPGLTANTSATESNTAAINNLTSAIAGANFSGGGASPGTGGDYGNGSPGTGAYGSGYAGYAGDGQTYGSLGIGNPKSYGGGSAPGATSPGGLSNISTSQWLGAVASLYGAYQAWTGGGNAIGKGLSTGSATMNMYGLYKSYMGQGMSPLMQGVGGVMGTVGGAYGLYNSLKNKDYVGSAMNAYSLYNSAKGLYGLYQAYNAGSIGVGSGAGASAGAVGSGAGVSTGAGASGASTGAWSAAGSGLGAGLAGAGAILAMWAQMIWQSRHSHNYGATLGGGSFSFGQNGFQMNSGFGAISGDDSFGNKQADKINTALNDVFGNINAQLGGMVDIVGGDAMANIAKALSGQGAIGVTSKLDQFLNTDQGKQFKAADDALMAYIRQNPMMAMGAGAMQSDEYKRLSQIRADLLKGSGLTQEDMSGFGVKSGSKNNFGAQNIVDQTIRTTFETTGLALAKEDAADFGSKLEALGFVAANNGWESDATVGMTVGMTEGFSGDIKSQMELLGFTGTMGGWGSEATMSMMVEMSDQGVSWDTIEQTLKSFGVNEETVKTLKAVFDGEAGIDSVDDFKTFAVLDPGDTETVKSMFGNYGSNDGSLSTFGAFSDAAQQNFPDTKSVKELGFEYWSNEGGADNWLKAKDILDYEGEDDTVIKKVVFQQQGDSSAYFGNTGGDGKFYGGYIGYGSGGKVIGGSGLKDDLFAGKIGKSNIMLTGGEFVINAESTRKNFGLLNKINSNPNFLGFASGGYANANDLLKDMRDTFINISPLKQFNEQIEDLLKQFNSFKPNADQRKIFDSYVSAGKSNLNDQRIDILKGLSPGTQLQIIADQFSDLRKQMVGLGATTGQLSQLDRLRKKALDEQRDSIKALMTSLDDTSPIQNITDQYNDLKKQMKDAGATQAQLMVVEKKRQQAIKDYIADIKKDHLDYINDLRLSTLAPTQSAASYQAKYDQLLKDAMNASGKDREDKYQKFQAYINEYLGFMATYSGNYNDIVAQVTAALTQLTKLVGKNEGGFVGFSSGGLVDNLFAGKVGQSNVMLTGGEFVINREDTAKNRVALEAINNGMEFKGINNSSGKNQNKNKDLAIVQLVLDNQIVSNVIIKESVTNRRLITALRRVSNG